MHLSLLTVLASSSFISARNLPRSSLQSARSAGIHGWSVQASTCPVGSTSCGDTAAGACCPSGMFCAKPANSEVAACCPSAGPCRGIIEAAPKCADAAWNLWAGLDGNDFCCEVGLLGAYDHISHRAGTCVETVVEPTTSAVLRSTGTGSAATSSAVATTSTICTTVTSAQKTSTILPATSSITSSAVSSSAKIVSDNVKAVAAYNATSSKAATSLSSKAASSGLATSTSASATAVATSPAAATGKPVFFHYMVGGINDAHCEQDIIDAIALGVDAFALNLAVPLNSSNSWAVDAVTSLFNYAQTYNFKLFFSFDMTGFTSPSQFIPILKTYVNNSAYYTYSGQPFVSTFNGGASTFTFGQDTVNDGWKNEVQAVMSAAGHPIYLIPAFQDVAASSSFFTTEYPTLNGTFNWNSWPTYSAGDVPVNTIDDVTYQTAAKAAGKGFMMGISPLQFKHIDSTQNWYRRGEENLEVRFGQVLSLQPDFIEFQTWNDAGESHYMGNSWPEPLVSNSTPEALSSIEYDHKGYWQILKSFIAVWKAGETSTATMYPTNGKDAQGTFWHHTLLKNGDCSSDSLGLGKPEGIEGVEDSVTAVVLVASGATGLTASISVGGKVFGTKSLAAGFNTMVVSNITTGAVSMNVTNAAGAVVVSGKGPLEVVDEADLCNYNFQVVGLS